MLVIEQTEEFKEGSITVYDVISPDGFGINREGYFKSPEDAQKGFDEWKQRFSHQGYYSSSNNGQIDLKHLENYCYILPIEKTNTENEQD